MYAPTNEVFVADGYGNRRVIVFDAETGAYKRHWGAYGNKPDDAAPSPRIYEGPGPQQFNTVHGIAVSNDGIVYVGDRVNNRIQAFQPGWQRSSKKYSSSARHPRGSAPDSARPFPATSSSASSTCPTGPTRKCRSSTAQAMEVVGFFGGYRRARRRRVLPHPQHRDRFQRQYLPRRGGHGPPRIPVELQRIGDALARGGRPGQAYLATSPASISGVGGAVSLGSEPLCLSVAGSGAPLAMPKPIVSPASSA